MNKNLGLIGTSLYIQNLCKSIKKYASAQFPILIEGESGTGKEIIAKALHALSPLSDRPMVTINCAAIPKNLEESEFFGHSKGSFTGAYTDKSGLIAQADNSTLFLDEIGEISLSMQAKLLRVLDSGEYLPIGKIKTETCHIRVISATNKNLQELVNNNVFRSDLFYRLKGAYLKTEPLNQHKEDIPSLVRYFLSQQPDEVPKEIDEHALLIISSEKWPGNVRELRYAMEVIGHAAIGQTKITAAVVSSVLNIDLTDKDYGTYKEEKQKVIKTFETEYFPTMLRIFNGNVSKAAKKAGMHRPNLVKKLKKLGINPNSYRP